MDYKVIYEGNRYLLRIPTSGGKAGKGHNLTSNIQAFDRRLSRVLKQFTFRVKDVSSFSFAERRAKEFLSRQPL